MILVVAEKPSVARDIARVVGAGTRHKGFLEGDGVRVSWCHGHMAELVQRCDDEEALLTATLQAQMQAHQQMAIQVKAQAQRLAQARAQAGAPSRIRQKVFDTVGRTRANSGDAT